MGISPLNRFDFIVSECGDDRQQLVTRLSCTAFCDIAEIFIALRDSLERAECKIDSLTKRLVDADQDVARLRAELTAEQAKCAALDAIVQERDAELTAERERSAALAAALERALKLGREMAGFVKSYGLDDWGPQSEYSRWAQCRSGLDNEADPSAILAARDADQRRKGAAWALRMIATKYRDDYLPAERLDIGPLCDDIEATADAIERKQVEVGE